MKAPNPSRITLIALIVLTAWVSSGCKLTVHKRHWQPAIHIHGPHCHH
jgi:hypothetical protein